MVKLTRFVSTPNLQLHKERLRILALRTRRFRITQQQQSTSAINHPPFLPLYPVELTIRRIDILPTLLAAHHIVHLFALQMLARRHLPIDGELVGARVAGPLVASGVIVVDDQAVGACWAEEHFGWDLIVGGCDAMLARSCC